MNSAGIGLQAKTYTLLHNRCVRPSSWQPSDFLPCSHHPSFHSDLVELQLKCQDLPRDVLAVIIGDMITEEALPSYSMTLNGLDGIRDVSGEDNHIWAKWLRTWSSEENKHGDVLKTFLYLSGRVNMREVEKTTQTLLQSGFSSGMLTDPYKAFIYTSFQERATKIAHSNTAKLAYHYGVPELGKMCHRIAQDEGVHEAVYSAIVKDLLESNPDRMISAMHSIFEHGVRMPAVNMPGFSEYSLAAEKLKVYTMTDYILIYEHLMKLWDIENIICKTEQGKKDQEALLTSVRKVQERIRDIRERTVKKKKHTDIVKIAPWFSV